MQCRGHGNIVALSDIGLRYQSVLRTYHLKNKGRKRTRRRPRLKVDVQLD